MLKRIRHVSFVGLVVIIVTVIAAYLVCMAVLRAGIKAEAIASPAVKNLSPATGTIGLDEGQVEIARDGSYDVTLDTKTLNIQMTDETTGRIFNTLSSDSKLPAAARSPVVIQYLGKDNSFYEWDAYTYSIANKWYEIERIKNGVRIKLDFKETEVYRLYEYVPMYISIDRYKEAFLQRLDERTADGTITKEKSAMYKRALDAFYAKDEKKGYYYNRSGGLPPVSILNLLVEFAGAVGYTKDELISDNAEFGAETYFKEPASFTLYLEVTFQNGELTVNIPVYEQQSGNDFYTMQSVSVFPAFDCLSAEKNDGYIFVPDGSGMLIALDSFNGSYPEYSRPVYNNTLFDTKYTKSDYDEDIHMPVFGMYSKDAKGRTSGFMAIIDSGAETAKISAKLKNKVSDGTGGLYNAVYASTDTMQYSRVKIFGPYSKDNSRYMATTGVIPFDFTIRYRLYTDDAGYYAFARDYRQDLINRNNIQVSYDNRPKVFLRMASAFTIWDKLLGIPYHPTISMTTYNQALGIMDDLSSVSMVVDYQYGLNGGCMNFFGNRAETVSSNGSEKDLKKLLSRSLPGNEVFMEANLMRVYRKGHLYNDKRFYAMGYDGASDWRSAFNDMWYPDDTFYTPYDFSLYYLVHPRYLSAVVDGFLKNAGQYPNIALTDFGSQYYGSYYERDIVDPVKANESVVIPNLKKIAAQKTVALDNPNADKIVYAAYSLDVSRESSDYGVSYTSVPFRQLVMSGITEFTTLDINGARSDPDYFLLQALELGAIPKFTVFSEKADVLMKAQISDYYAAQYADTADTIKDLYARYQTAFSEIGTKEIVNHQMLKPGVFMTTYANGVNVLVNYNLYGVTVGSHTMGSLGYEIIPAGEALNVNTEEG